jgi:hypothetical protein
VASCCRFGDKPSGSCATDLINLVGRAMTKVVSYRPSLRRLGFAPGSVHLGFVVNTVALGQVTIRVLRFSAVSIIPPWLSTRIYLGMNNSPVVGRSSET